MNFQTFESMLGIYGYNLVIEQCSLRKKYILCRRSTYKRDEVRLIYTNLSEPNMFNVTLEKNGKKLIFKEFCSGKGY